MDRMNHLQKEMERVLRESAEQVTVPERLKPEQIEKLCRSGRGRRMQRLYLGYAAMAAVAVIVCGSMLLTGMGEHFMQKEEQSWQSTEGSSVPEEISNAGSGQSDRESTVIVDKEPIQRSDAGELYRVAESYDQVYDLVTDYGSSDGYYYLVVEEFAEEVRKEMVTDGFASGSAVNKSVYDAVAEPESVATTAQKLSHSTTNLQTEGVDESDIVKTDGSFLYLVNGDEVLIVDIRQGVPKLLSRLHPGEKGGSAEILELYVDGDKLVVIGQEYETALMEEQNASRDSAEKRKLYHTVSRSRSVMYTYSLTDPAQPKALGCFAMDGRYYTSRKIGGMVYLFTTENMLQRCYEESTEEDGWIPVAGTKKIAADGIYLPEQGGSSLIIASVALAAPEEAVDSVMIVNEGAEIYVGAEAIYLYHTEWMDQLLTEIAKFTFRDGVINAQAAASVKGMVQDTFAVSENQGLLRILTCEQANEGGSNLYILDEKLSVKGSLTGIAPGETVYAARFLGDMAYFVTYRNMDPLFAADLSDPAQPKLLGELKITGYSEYLHLWSGQKLLGIGYETDPDSGSREGVKLSMFDISDPAALNVKDSLCITNADDSPAMNRYKTVLADPGRNLIGFAVTEYGKGWKNTYLLFEWDGAAFRKLLTVELGEIAEQVRGMYAGDYFYIVDSGRILAFDMTQGFAAAGELNY